LVDCQFEPKSFFVACKGQDLETKMREETRQRKENETQDM